MRLYKLQLVLVVNGIAAVSAFTPVHVVGLRGRQIGIGRAVTDETPSPLKDAIKQFSNGNLSKEKFENLVKSEEAKQEAKDAAIAAEQAAIAAEQAAIAAAEKKSLTAFATGGLAFLGLVTGGLLDGALAGGEAPWASPVAATAFAAAAFALASQESDLSDSFVKGAGGATQSALGLAGGAAKGAVDGAVAGVQTAAEAAVAEVKAAPSKAAAAAQEAVAEAVSEVQSAPSKLSAAAQTAAAEAQAEAVRSVEDAVAEAKAAPGRAVAEAKQSVDDAVSGVKGFLGVDPAAPSKPAPRPSAPPPAPAAKPAAPPVAAKPAAALPSVSLPKMPKLPTFPAAQKPPSKAPSPAPAAKKAPAAPATKKGLFSAFTAPSPKARSADAGTEAALQALGSGPNMLNKLTGLQEEEDLKYFFSEVTLKDGEDLLTDVKLPTTLPGGLKLPSLPSFSSPATTEAALPKKPTTKAASKAPSAAVPAKPKSPMFSFSLSKPKASPSREPASKAPSKVAPPKKAKSAPKKGGGAARISVFDLGDDSVPSVNRKAALKAPPKEDDFSQPIFGRKKK